MSDGLGAVFLAVTLLAVLAGLAAFVVVTTLAPFAYHRRAERLPDPARYLLAAACAGVFGVAGFGVLVLADEAPPVAWLFAAVVLAPLVGGGASLVRTTRLSLIEVVATTVAALAGPFFVGVVVAVGATNGINSAFDLAPAESRRMGVPWIAATAGGLAVLLGTLRVGDHLGWLARSATDGESPA